MLLKYVNEDYDDTVYALDANESDKNHWPSNKDNLGLDFPNLPYYIDDQIKSSQSGTILRYLGRKYKMAGTNEQETTTIEMLIDTATDLKTIIGFPAYTSADDEVINLSTSNLNICHMPIATHRLGRRIANFNLFIVKQSFGQSQEVGLFFSVFVTHSELL